MLYILNHCIAAAGDTALGGGVLFRDGAAGCSSPAGYGAGRQTQTAACMPGTALPMRRGLETDTDRSNRISPCQSMAVSVNEG